jgi:HSP20 family protein
MSTIMRRSPFDIFEWTPSMFNTEWEFPTLKVEEYTEGDHLVINAEIPGIDPDKDVKITVTDGRLRIEAERTEESEKRDKDTYRSEFKYGSFVRDVPLPLGAKKDSIKASYKNGILTVKVPAKKEGEDVATVPITKG